MAKAYVVIINDCCIDLYSTKAKAQKALAQAFKGALTLTGVTAAARREAKKYWKLDKTSFAVDVEEDAGGRTHTVQGYMVSREIQ